MKRWGPFFVRGVPAAFATAREDEWRHAIRDQVMEAWKLGYLEERCQIQLRFLLPPEKAEITDLDNLLKPCIDALGSVIFRPARQGHRTIWNTDDHWIYRFDASKDAAASQDECGVEITVESLG